MEKFKAGKYYVGDLCYVITDENWDKLLDETDCLESENQTFKGEKIASHGTYCGDGSYEDQKGRKYSVDAGIIGIMPAHLMEDTSDGGQVIEFKEDFTFEYDDGIFYIGDIEINTKGYDEEEDEEYDYEYDEYDDEEDYEDDDE